MAKISKEACPEPLGNTRDKLSRGDVEHVGKLARIKIQEDEIGKFTSELGAILDYVDELESAPTENIEPISQSSGLKDIAREDEITESPERDLMLENAPDKDNGFIKVKKIFE